MTVNAAPNASCLPPPRPSPQSPQSISADLHEYLSHCLGGVASRQTSLTPIVVGLLLLLLRRTAHGVKARALIASTSVVAALAIARARSCAPPLRVCEDEGEHASARATPSAVQDSLGDLLAAWTSPREGDEKTLRIAVVHCRVDARQEATFLQRELQRLLDGSGEVQLLEDSYSHSDAVEAIRASAVVVFLQSASSLTRATTLLYLLLALEEKKPMVGARIASGPRAYNLVEAAAFVARLESRLGKYECDYLRRMKVSLSNSAWVLSEQLPLLRSWPIDEADPRGVEALLRGALVAVPVPPPALSRDEWLQRRNGLGAAHPSPSASREAPEVPPGVPALPKAYDATGSSRATLLLEARQILTSAERSPGLVKLALRGAGGAGKTTLLAALVRLAEVRCHFDAVVWLTVGQSPDTPRLLRDFLRHVDEAASGALAGPELTVALARATRGKQILLALDDVWATEDARALCALDEATRSACVLSTRIGEVLADAVELPVGQMDADEAVGLLLRTARLAELADAPPVVARDVVELCGRIPLLLSLAGAIIATREHEEWQTWIVETLKGGRIRALDDTSEVPTADLRMRSVEERVITQSLLVAVANSRKRGGFLSTLFLHFAAFAEDVVVPVATFDALAPMLADCAAGDGTGDPPPPQSRAVSTTRTCLLALLRHSLVSGSITAGVSTHDIVRAYAIEHVERRPGGLRAMQRRVLDALLDALAKEHGTPASGRSELSRYAVTQLAHHVHGAMGEAAKLVDDPLVLRALTAHVDEGVRQMVARGVGEGRAALAAEECEACGRHALAAGLWLAAGMVSHDDAASHRRRACATARRVAPPTRVTAAIEARALGALMTMKKGIPIGSEEHRAAMTRLGSLKEHFDGSGEEREAVPQVNECFDENRFLFLFRDVCNKEGSATVSAAHSAEVSKARYALKDVSPSLRCLSVVRDAFGGNEDAVLGFSLLGTGSFTRAHTDPAYDWEREYGEDGEYLYALEANYSFDFHETCRTAYGRDSGYSGLCGVHLLLHWGDVVTAQRDFRRATTCVRTIYTRIRKGAVPWSKYHVDQLDIRSTRAVAFSIGDLETARSLFDCSVEGEAMASADPRGMLEELVVAGSRWMAVWKMEVTWTLDSTLLMARAMHALLHQRTSAHAVARWLPRPQALVELAEREKAWDVWLMGAQHPSVACAHIYAAQGETATAAELAGELLERLAQPLIVIELRRLRARCRGGSEAVLDLKAAVDTAASAGYLWMEVLVLRDLLLLEDAAECRARLARCLRKVRSPLEKVFPLLGPELDAARIVHEN